MEWLLRLEQLHLHGLLADDMGLGKTVQVIAFISLCIALKPTLIIVPTTLIFNWKKEFEKFLPSRKVVIHQGPGRARDPKEFLDANVIITSYAILRIDLPLFQNIEFAKIILDEAQAIKNFQSQTAQAVLTFNQIFDFP